MTKELYDIALKGKAWPFEEARNLLKKIEKNPPEKGYVLFETGYGPSGLPHIGTFNEVFRTTLVQHAFEQLSDIPTKLIAFSDDMDGLRKVPENIPNKEMVAEHLQKPLTSVPDPFGTAPSFGEHNNGRLCQFLDHYGFNYEFASSTEYYKSGRFDETLLKILEKYEDIINIILPTLGKERQQTYSPFLPICPKTGQVLQVAVVERNPEKGTIVYQEEDGSKTEVPVTGGHCKLQWKVDWAMRWTALDVNYEMAGKDLIESVHLSSRICKILGKIAPVGFSYELFLDDKGEKISKSVGNGIALEEWLRYAPKESLCLFVYQKPKTAKKLYFDVIPKAVEEYYSHLKSFEGQEPEKQVENPVWHIHSGNPPKKWPALSFNLLLNLAGACHAHDKSVLWGFITRYSPESTPETDPEMDQLVGHALHYYQDFILPQKKYRLPTDLERAALEELQGFLTQLPANADAETIQNGIYQIGKSHEFENLKDWFRALYETLLGQSQGPRMGSFVLLYGVSETADLIDRVLKGEDLSKIA